MRNCSSSILTSSNSKSCRIGSVRETIDSEDLRTHLIVSSSYKCSICNSTTTSILNNFNTCSRSTDLISQLSNGSFLTSLKVNLFNPCSVSIKCSDLFTKDEKTKIITCSISCQVTSKSCSATSNKFTDLESSFSWITINSITNNISNSESSTRRNTNQIITWEWENTTLICKGKSKCINLFDCYIYILNTCRRLRGFFKDNCIILNIKGSSRSLNNAVKNNHQLISVCNDIITINSQGERNSFAIKQTRNIIQSLNN